MDQKSIDFLKNNNEKSIRPSYSVKYLGLTNGKIGILTKKNLIPYKDQNFVIRKQNIFSESGKLCHTFSIPRKLITVHRQDLEKDSKIISHKTEPKKIRPETHKKRLVRITTPIKIFTAKPKLLENSHYHEAYLKQFVEKYRYL